ncbi:MAG: uridylate kinase [Anaerolineae bacterium]|nr:uridylate kinase [Anaerolineae bacterium]
MSDRPVPTDAELIFVKLGGSVITDKAQVSMPRLEVIERLAGEIASAKAARPGLQMLLGHGSGSFGHVVGARYRLRDGVTEDAGAAGWWGYVETGAVAAQLNRIVTEILVRVGVPVVSISPSASARCRGGKLVSMESYPIAQALRRGLVPMVHGDVAFDEVQGCTIISTESVFAYLVEQFCPSRMILVGEVDGIFDRDPQVHRDARHIAHLAPDGFAQVEAGLGGSHGVDVTGGMLTKVRQVMALVGQQRIRRAHLISGLKEGALERVIVDPEAAEGSVIER